MKKRKSGNKGTDKCILHNKSRDVPKTIVAEQRSAKGDNEQS